MRFAPDIERLAAEVVGSYKARGEKIVTAESCTGGLVAGALTSIPGASEVLERGFVSYSNDAKIDLLGVLPETLANFGAVSAETAEAMAEGALDYSHADKALAITGIAGPGGGSPKKPVGLVFFGIATKNGARFHARHVFEGDRDSVRDQAVKEGLTLLRSLVD